MRLPIILTSWRSVVKMWVVTILYLKLSKKWHVGWGGQLLISLEMFGWTMEHMQSRPNAGHLWVWLTLETWRTGAASGRCWASEQLSLPPGEGGPESEGKVHIRGTNGNLLIHFITDYLLSAPKETCYKQPEFKCPGKLPSNRNKLYSLVYYHRSSVSEEENLLKCFSLSLGRSVCRFISWRL